MSTSTTVPFDIPSVLVLPEVIELEVMSTEMHGSIRKNGPSTCFVYLIMMFLFPGFFSSLDILSRFNPGDG